MTMGFDQTERLGAHEVAAWQRRHPAFLQQFLGLSPSIELVKNQPPAGNEIQAVTGATISSRAVLDGVNAALDAARQLQKGR